MPARPQTPAARQSGMTEYVPREPSAPGTPARETKIASTAHAKQKAAGKASAFAAARKFKAPRGISSSEDAISRAAAANPPNSKSMNGGREPTGTK